MNALNKTLLYGAGLATSFVLGIWFSPAPKAVMPEIRSEQPAPPKLLAAAPKTGTENAPAANVYALIATAPRSAMEEAMKLPDSTRLATLQNVMAVWLRQDRLAAAEWMTEKRGLREFEPLSAQVSDAFFPDDTEMSALFSFDLTDAALRDVRVNRLAAYWKSGAHLKFDNSPWEVDGPGTGPAKSPTSSVTPVEPITETAAAENEPATKTEPQG